MNKNLQPVGMVLGSREAGALDFWVAVEEGKYLRLDDLIYVEFQHPDTSKGSVRYYGMVDEVIKLYEGSQFDTDVFLARKDLLPVSLSYAAHIQVTRLMPEEYLPPDPGSPVFLAQSDQLELALYYDNMKNQAGSTRLPVGILKNGEVAYLNLEFLNGVKGGHVNISGISGVATKTSYATFLLYSLFNSGVLKDSASAKALVFNVKGEDLFFLDKPNNRLEGSHADRYTQLGLKAGPFKSASFRAPPTRTDGDLLPDVVERKTDVVAYYWDLVQFCRDGLLPFLFTDRGSMTNLGFLIDQVTERLRRLVGDDKTGQKGPHLHVSDWEDPEGLSDAGIVSWDSLDKVPIRSFSQLVRYIEFKLLGPEAADDEDKKSKGDPKWTARQASGTLEAFVRRLRAAVGNVQHLIRGDKLGQRPDPLTNQAQLNIVDIHQLSAQAQMFVVGSILREVFTKKEAGRQGRVFVVLDELNKYAPREEESPIKDILLDIAERGRSLGVILIGAQQTASEVERRIVANAAIRVVGRLDAAEAERPEYRYLPSSFRERAVILPQGTMIVQQPELPIPLPLTFPFPAWATKREEVAEDNSAKALKDLLN